jgi:hypothetical protein
MKIANFELRICESLVTWRHSMLEGAEAVRQTSTDCADYTDLETKDKSTRKNLFG